MSDDSQCVEPDGRRGWNQRGGVVNHYFREGFRRGDEDACYGRYRYGRYSNGRGTIQGNILTVILTLESIR